MWDLLGTLLPWLLPAFAALLGGQALIRGRFPPTEFWLPGWIVGDRTLVGWRARAVGLVLIAQLVLGPLVGPTVGSWLGVRTWSPAPSTEGYQAELDQIQRRQKTLDEFRSRTDKQLAAVRSAHQSGDLSEQEYQEKVGKLTTRSGDYNSQDEILRQRVDQIHRALADQRQASDQRIRSRLCVARTCEGLVILMVSLAVVLIGTITCGTRTHPLPDAEPALEHRA
jgi:hypothetical protein